MQLASAKVDRHWRGWRHIERGVLMATCITCTYVASEPLHERFVAWQSQRALEAQWQGALANSSTKGKDSSGSKQRTQGRLLSWPKHHTSESKDPNEEILWPLTKLSCSKIGLDVIVVQGTGTAELKSGPGHEVNTSFPGGPNCVIAAHRNAYGWWFYHLDDLAKGDTLVLQVPGRKYIYRVAASRIVSVRDTSILQWQAQNSPRLTLYTCTLPKTKSRLVVIANLQHSEAT